MDGTPTPAPAILEFEEASEPMALILLPHLCSANIISTVNCYKGANFLTDFLPALSLRKCLFSAQLSVSMTQRSFSPAFGECGVSYVFQTRDYCKPRDEQCWWNIATGNCSLLLLWIKWKHVILQELL